jgi:hypothetical protein
MRMKLLAAMIAGTALLGFQAAAWARAESGLGLNLNNARANVERVSSPTPLFASGRADVARRYYDRASPWCASGPDPSNQRPTHRWGNFEW